MGRTLYVFRRTLTWCMFWATTQEVNVGLCVVVSPRKNVILAQVLASEPHRWLASLAPTHI